MISWSQLSWDLSTGPIFTIFSPNGRYLIVDHGSHPFFTSRLRDVVMPTNFVDKLATTLAFRIGLCRITILILEDKCRNLMKISPWTVEIMTQWWFSYIMYKFGDLLFWNLWDFNVKIIKFTKTLMWCRYWWCHLANYKKLLWLESHLYGKLNYSKLFHICLCLLPHAVVWHMFLVFCSIFFFICMPICLFSNCL